MKVMAIYGNPKQGGFVHGCLDVTADYLAEKGVGVEKVVLIEKAIEECRGCFTCLKTGLCVLDDDMNALCAAMREADGFVVGASVRNGFFPALVKKFYERITYPIGFTRDLANKPVLAIGAVGFAGGRRALGRLITFAGIEALVVDYLFFRTGIPTTLTVDRVAPRLRAAAAKLLAALERPRRRPLIARIRSAVDDFIVRKCILERDRHGTYDHIIKVWQDRGRM